MVVNIYSGVTLKSGVRLFGTTPEPPEPPAPSGPGEFDVVGATYYAVAPAGYSYSAEQDTNYNTRKYNTLADAFTALPSSLSAPAVINVIGQWSSADSSTVSKSLTTSASNYLLLRGIGDARHPGYWTTTNAYRNITNVDYERNIEMTTQYFYIDGLQFSNEADPTTFGAAFRLNMGSGRNYFVDKCIIKTISTTQYALTTDVSDGTLTVTRSLFLGPGTVDSGACYFSGTTYIYNCTAVGFVYAAFDSYDGIAINVGCHNCTTGFRNDWVLTTCSTTSPTFVNDGTDYHLASGDTTWKGQGTDLSSDGHYPITDDIDGDTISSWPIGMDAG